MSLRQAYEKISKQHLALFLNIHRWKWGKKIEPDNISQSWLRSLSHTFWSLNILQGRVCPWNLGSDDGKQNSCQKQGRDRVRKDGQASWVCWVPHIMCEMYWSFFLRHVPPPPELQKPPSPMQAHNCRAPATERNWLLPIPWAASSSTTAINNILLSQLL